MKLVGIVIIAGLILLYFMDVAFKLNPFNAEMLIHSGLMFLTGFLILGIGVFYAHKVRLKFAIGLILAVVLADAILDYTRNIDSFKPEVLLHGLYMLIWGSLTGYVLMKHWMDRVSGQE
jgi:FtsH-binding integral membrane protein